MIASTLDKATVPSQIVEIPIAGARLTTHLMMPRMARGLVVVASADGEHLYSRVNQLVAEQLGRDGLATLVVELLTPEEMREDAETSELRFNQPLVSARLVRVVSWVRSQLPFVGLEIGCLAGGICAGSALAAAAVLPAIRSVVCLGARFELAEALLDRVHASVLLLVGQHDTAHLASNRRALARLTRTSQLRVVNEARHLFDEPFLVERVARHASVWFERTLLCDSRLAAKTGNGNGSPPMRFPRDTPAVGGQE
jgi:dienelactone hydrolase